MDKHAMVKEGETPSELSGNKSTMVKNGKAFAAGEKDELTAKEEALAKQMSAMYNTSRKQ